MVIYKFAVVGRGEARPGIILISQFLIEIIDRDKKVSIGAIKAFITLILVI